MEVMKYTRSLEKIKKKKIKENKDSISLFLSPCVFIHFFIH